MGYAMCFGPCITCGKTFGFNPNKVPSTMAVTGKREPICENCFDLINSKRVAAGLEPFVRSPDAYEACDEDEL